MKYLKLFENFDDNKQVINALKDILSCIKNGEKITSKLNGGTIMDLHDKCEDEQVMEFLSKAAEIAGEEYQGIMTDLKTEFDANELEGLIRILEGNPEKDEAEIKLERFSKFLESHNKSVHISEDEMNLFSQEPALQELITKNKITLKNGQVLFDEGDLETIEILDQYLEMPGKIEESWLVYESKKPTKSSSFDEKHKWMYKNIPEYKKKVDELLDKFLDETKKKDKEKD